LLVLVVSAAAGATSQRLSQGITDIALKISASKERSTGGTSNFLLSPYSLHSAFSQLLLGTDGNTRLQLENALGIGVQDTANYARLESSLRAGNSVLKVANLMAMSKEFQPLPSYTKKLRNRFDSQLMTLDFLGNPVGSVRKVNEFVSTATSGKIDEILSEDQVDSDTNVILINAIYFKALWQMAFRLEDTFSATFRTPNLDKRVDFMNSKMKVRLVKTGDYSVVELPYQDQSKAMLIILPEPGVSTDNIIPNISRSIFNEIRRAQPEDTIVTIPKFTIRDRNHLQRPMEELGVTSLFQPFAANLSRLTNNRSPPLYVTDAVQDAFVEVNEAGTEAAAATAVVIGLRTSKRTRQFFADRPFVFIVYDFAAQLPLFVGKVVDPQASGSVSVRSGSSNSGVDNSQLPGKLQQQPPLQPQAPAIEAGIAGASNVNDDKAKSFCMRVRSDFPAAVNNEKLCRMAENTKRIDWLRQYRVVCEQSQSVTKSFQKNNCTADWCAFALTQQADWKKDNNRLCIPARKLARDDAYCRELSNNLNAMAELRCTPTDL